MPASSSWNIDECGSFRSKRRSSPSPLSSSSPERRSVTRRYEDVKSRGAVRLTNTQRSKYGDRSSSRDRSHRKRSYSPDRDGRKARGSKDESKRRARHDGSDHRRSHRDEDRNRDDDYDQPAKRRRSSSLSQSRSHSPPRRRNNDRDRDRNRHRRRKSLSHSRSPQPFKRSLKALPDQKQAFTQDDSLAVIKPDPPKDKEKPNFSTTGRLAAASNTVTVSSTKSIVLKYHEPAESRKPSPRDKWRLYVFKADAILETIELWERSCWLFGREESVVDVPVMHPSVSGQQAVLQFRWKQESGEFGEEKGKVKLYLLDLESSNGTDLNGEKVPGGRYVEVRDGDAIKLGFSEREYVVQLPPRE